MQTTYKPVGIIDQYDLFDGRLLTASIRELVFPDFSTLKHRCLTDGHNYIWVSIGNRGRVTQFDVYKNNDPTRIFGVIFDVVGVKVMSESALINHIRNRDMPKGKKRAATSPKELEDAFYEALQAYINGADLLLRREQDYDRAMIAMQEIKAQPELAFPENRDGLFERISTAEYFDAMTPLRSELMELTLEKWAPF